MPHPWEPPPIPTRGNRSSRTLYESIGRFLATWEEIEIALSHLYAAAVGQTRFDAGATQAYGKKYNFQDRITALEAAFLKHSIRAPNQGHESRFREIITQIRGYSARRNDVAHGIVRLINIAQDPQSTLLATPNPPEWCLVPPDFGESKFVSPYIPAYALTSREINRLAANFWPIARQVFALASEIELLRHASRRKSPLPLPPPHSSPHRS
jgi:hypothetical protein